MGRVVSREDAGTCSLFLVCVCVCVCVCVLSHFCCVQLFATLWTEPTRLLHPWDSPGKNTGVGCHVLLQGIFLTLTF